MLDNRQHRIVIFQGGKKKGYLPISPGHGNSLQYCGLENPIHGEKSLAGYSPEAT